MSSIHWPVDAWAAPALAVVTRLLNAVYKHLPEPLTPLLRGTPHGKGLERPWWLRWLRICLHSLCGHVPSSGTAGSHGNSVCDSWGASVRPFAGLRRLPTAVHRGPASRTPASPRSGLLCLAGTVTGVRWVLVRLFFSFSPCGFGLHFPDDQWFTPSLKKYPLKYFARF